MRFSLLLAFLVLGVFILACGSGGSGGGGGNERDKEKLRVVHAAPTLGKITILKDEEPITEQMLYGTSTDYIEIDEGAKSIFSVRVEPEFVIPVLAVEESVVGPYKKTLLVTESGGQPVLTFIGDQTTTSIPSNESRLRFINAASVATSIDVYVTSPGTSLVNRSPVVSKLAFKAASSYFPTTPGEYRVRVAVNTGTSTSSSTGSTATASSTGSAAASSASNKAPDIDFDSSDYPIDSGEEVSFILLENRGGGRPYRSLTLRAPGD